MGLLLSPLVFESRVFQRAKSSHPCFWLSSQACGLLLSLLHYINVLRITPNCLSLEESLGAGELGQQLRIHVAFPENSDSIPSLHMKLRTCNSSFRGSNAPF